MTVEPVTMYSVRCDRCRRYAEDGTDYYAWVDADRAIDHAHAAGWLTRYGILARDYCPNCTEWTPEEVEQVPKAAATETIIAW